VLGEVCFNDVEVIPDESTNKDWFAHKVCMSVLPCSVLASGLVFKISKNNRDKPLFSVY